MRRNLTRPIAPAPLPAGFIRVQFDAAIAPACRALMNSAYADGTGDIVAFDVLWPWLTGDADYDPALVQVVTYGAEVAAFCHAWTGSFIKDVAVRPDYRRRRLATALVTRALEDLAARGHPTVDLKTPVHNLPAQTLYRRLGFEIVMAG